MKTFINWSIFLYLNLFTLLLYSQTTTFSTSTSLPVDLDLGTNYASCASPGTKSFSFTVSGLSTLNTSTNQLQEINFRLDANCGGNLQDVSCYIKSPSGTCVRVATQLGTTTNYNIAPLNKVDYTFRNNVSCLNNKVPDYSASPSTVPAANDQDGRYGIFPTDGNISTSFNGQNPNGIWVLYFFESGANVPCLTSASIDFGDPSSSDQTANGDNCINAINWTGSPICASTNGKTGSTNMPLWNGGSFNTGCDWNAANNNDVWIRFTPSSANVCIAISGLIDNLQSIVVTDSNTDGDNNACTGTNGTYWNIVSCPRTSDVIYAAVTGTARNHNHCFTATPGQTYYLVVDGNGGAESPFYITGINGFDCPPSLASVTSSLTCSTNTISLSASPLSGVTYTWTGPGIVSGSNTATPIVNQPGNYTLSVSSATGSCGTSTSVVTVSQNTTAPTPGASNTTTLTCTTTTAQLTGTGGGTYSWSGPGITGGGSTASPTVNLPGTYTVIVTAANGCTATANTSVSQNTTAPTPGASNTTTLTCTTTTAQLTGTGGGTYSWSGPGITGGGSTTSPTVNLPGTYTVIVTAANGCTATANTSVSQNTTMITPTISVSATLNCTLTSINLNANPNSGLTYTWTGTGITSGSSTASITLNQPGTYSLAVTNIVNGCIGSNSVSVSQNTTTPTFTLTPSSHSTTCASPTVQITASGTGLTYSWTPPATGSLNNINIANPIANGSGVFTVVATSTVNGCSSAIATATVVADASAPTVSLSTSSTSLSCLATAQTVTASVSAGTFSYVWSPAPSSGAGTGTVTITNPGTYSVTVTNTVNGCATDAFVSVTQSTVAPMVSASAPSSITCLSPTTSAVASTTTSPASYNWSGPGVVSGNTTATVNVNTGGTYNYTVTDSNNGCSSSGTITVNEDTSAPTLTLAPASHTTTCASPTVQLTVSGTPGSLTYTWTSPSTGSLSDNSIANPVASGSGVFTVAATNTVNGCSTPNGIYTATVIADAGLPVVNLSAPSLTLDCNAAAQTVTANVSIGSVTYSWSPAPSSGQGSSSATFDTPGTYTVVVTNTVNGCENTSLVSVNQNTIAPVLAAISDQTLTCALPTTSLTASASPSVGTSYNWSGPSITSGANAATANVNAGGAYTVIATAANGCTASATANVIDNNVPITATVTPSSTITNITCTNTMVTLSASATPTNDIVFVWSTGGSTANENVSLPGVVTVTLINSVTGCSTTAQFAVTQNTLAPDVAFANATFPCGPLTSTVNASSTNTNVSYTWSGTGIVSGASSSSPEINAPGIYSVTITDNITGCSTNTTVVVGLASINASFTPSSNVGEVPAVISFSNQSTGADTYAWSFGDGGSSTDINPNYTYNTQGSYTVILTASAGLCSDTAATIIIIDEGFEVYIPNVFTPNNDGPNDVFYVKTKGVKDLQGDIFNRWGQLMYSMKGVNDVWDGKAPNKELVPDGTYFYIINIKDNKNKNHIYNGSVNLYR